MGWWVNLERDGHHVAVDRHEEGGTFPVGGSTFARMSVTYNYGSFFEEAWEEPLERVSLPAMLNGRTAEETIPLLEKAVEFLGRYPGKSYWEAVPGNAGRCLATLLEWARKHPDAKWRVT